MDSPLSDSSAQTNTPPIVTPSPTNPPQTQSPTQTDPTTATRPGRGTTINYLPVELISRILSYLPPHSLASFARVSKGAQELAIPLLYRVISVHTNAKVMSVCMTLANSPELAKNVKSLGLNNRHVPPPPTPGIYGYFEQRPKPPLPPSRTPCCGPVDHIATRALRNIGDNLVEFMWSNPDRPRRELWDALAQCDNLRNLELCQPLPNTAKSPLWQVKNLKKFSLRLLCRRPSDDEDRSTSSNTYLFSMLHNNCHELEELVIDAHLEAHNYLDIFAPPHHFLLPNTFFSCRWPKLSKLRLKRCSSYALEKDVHGFLLAHPTLVETDLRIALLVSPPSVLPPLEVVQIRKRRDGLHLSQYAA